MHKTLIHILVYMYMFDRHFPRFEGTYQLVYRVRLTLSLTSISYHTICMYYIKSINPPTYLNLLYPGNLPIIGLNIAVVACRHGHVTWLFSNRTEQEYGSSSSTTSGRGIVRPILYRRNTWIL
jgi:hypothetical protein